MVPERKAGETPPRPAPSAALEAARRLVERDRQRTSPSSQDQMAEALCRACDRVVHNLRESMGDDGCDTLFARAVSQSKGMHPVLTQLRDAQESGLSRERVSDAVKADETAARASVEALLAALIDILARLIGEDMALRIIDRDPEGDLPSAGASGIPS